MFPSQHLSAQLIRALRNKIMSKQEATSLKNFFLFPTLFQIQISYKKATKSLKTERWLPLKKYIRGVTAFELKRIIPHIIFWPKSFR